MYCLDEKFWLAISFFLFLYCAYRPLKKVILASLDAKITAIQEQVVEARKLNEDANLLFENITKQLQQIGELRNKMLQDGQKNTNKLIEVRHKEIEILLERKKTETMSLMHNQKIQACKMIQSKFCDKIIDLLIVYFQSQNNSLLDSEIAQQFIKNQAKDLTKNNVTEIDSR